MPLFALANAGVSFAGADLESSLSQNVFIAVILALVVGKPLGVILSSYVLLKLKWCELPSDVGWAGIVLVGLLAGIGFTMSIFIASLAFDDPALLAASKLSVLCASGAAAVLGLSWIWMRRLIKGKKSKVNSA